jgi:DNA-binding response OmpR family regulator
MPRRPLLLIVEDDPVLRDLFRVALSIANFAVHACGDGLDALHFLDQSRPDVIVLDLDLPRVSGMVLYDDMRARKRADRVPILVVTGMPNVPPLTDATLLRKPVTPEQLIKAIESVLKLRDRTWLYARGKRSVLIARIAFPGPDARLHVYGPGKATAVLDCSDFVECMKCQSDIERRLVAGGYRLLSTERRTDAGHRPRDVRERRRDPSDLSL